MANEIKSLKIGSTEYPIYPDKAINATNLIMSGDNFETPGAGWYKLAYIKTTDARGSVRLALTTTGGNYTPRYTELKVSNGWSNIVINQTGKFNWISKYRYTVDDTYSYIEAYFTGKCHIYLRKFNGTGYIDDTNYGWTLYGTATAGSGKVEQSEFNASPNSNLYTNGIIASVGGFHSVGYDNNYILLAGSGHKAITDFAPSVHTHTKANITDFDHTHDYLPISGGTLTGPVEIKSTVNNDYNEGLRITRAANNWAGITFGSTGLKGAPTDGWFAATNPDNQFIISPGSSSNTTGLTLNSGGNAKWRNSVIVTAANVGSYALTSLPSHNHDYLPLTGGNMSGDNCWIGSTMGGGTDSWRIGGYGSSDNGECRITINDNANDKFAIQIEDYQGTIYRPLVVESGNVTATKFTGPLVGDVTGNCSGSSGSCTGNAATATKATNDSDGNAINSTYLKKSGGTMTGNITYDTDSHGIYFYNNCGIEKWTGYGPCLVAEGNTTDFWVRNGTDRSKAYKIYHAGNLSKSTLGLGNVDNTADANKSVNYATTAGSAEKLGTYTPANLISGYVAHHANITVPSAGWYKIASYSSTGYQPRGLTCFTVYATGGSTSPFTLEIKCDLSWAWPGSITVSGYNPYGIKARMSRSSDTTFIELYFNSAISEGLCLRVPYSAYTNGHQNNAWTWVSGTLTTASATSFSTEVGGVSGISTTHGFNHTHTTANITDFPTSLPANGGSAQYATRLGNASGYYTKATLDTALAGKADSSHGTHVTTGAQTWSGVKTFSSAPVFSAGFTSSSNVTVTGKVSASSGFYEESDERLKSFKDPLKVDLEKLSKLRKSYFTFNSDPDNLQIGVSAQEIQSLYPELVSENENGNLTVAYDKLSVIALAAVDKLSTELNTLKDELQQIKAHLNLI